ncbi:MAG: hypothetical protein CVV16_10860 [Gammaproteobacteria bacterium HGW-Gammaproteobacteria-6]|nr:MAG: hypothetical protein CVV16_10860 [Gammaproteobacteria bacterium HGW-Gammaproteobacteria-6]
MPMSSGLHFARTWVVALAVFATLPVFAQQADTSELRPDDPAVLTSEVMPHAVDHIITDAVRTLSGYAAVGERGHLLLSANGVEWTQAQGVPTRATLNAITAVGDDLWVGGHDGVILHSPDAGNTWVRQRIDVWSPEAFEPADGAPILDLLFIDKNHGFAIGAYSLFLETFDGGASWEKRTLPPPPEEADVAGTGGLANSESWTFDADDLVLDAVTDPHLNGLVRTTAGELMIAAERGAAFRSRDDGVTWERIALPYGGSMFGVIAWDAGHVLMYGLRGKVFETNDLGDNWRELETGISSSLMGGIAHSDGGAILVGAQGAVLSRNSAADPFVRAKYLSPGNETPILAGLLDHPEGGFVVYGERGVDRYRPQ